MSADVDVIVNGHTHKMYNCMAPVPGSDELRPVLQAGEYAANIGQIPLLVNTTGEVSVDTANFQLHRRSARRIREGNDRVDQVAQIVADAGAEAEILGGEVIGSIEGDITTAFQVKYATTAATHPQWARSSPTCTATRPPSRAAPRSASSTRWSSR